MMASELIATLVAALAEHGDQEILMSIEHAERGVRPMIELYADDGTSFYLRDWRKS